MTCSRSVSIAMIMCSIVSPLYAGQQTASSSVFSALNASSNDKLFNARAPVHDEQVFRGSDTAVVLPTHDNSVEWSRYVASLEGQTLPGHHAATDGKDLRASGRVRHLPPRHDPAAARTSDVDVYAGTDVLHYALDIEILPEYDGGTVSDVGVRGRSTIDVEVTQDKQETFVVDLRDNLEVDAVDGNSAKFYRIDDGLEIVLDRPYLAGETFQVSIDYHGYPVAESMGAFKWWLRDEKLVVGTLSEPFYAHYWWPCKDTLEDKATMEMRITVPDDMVAVSNGILLGWEPLEGARVRYSWAEDYPMETYLASLAITGYKYYGLEYAYDDGAGLEVMPVDCFVYPDHWSDRSDEPLPAYKRGCDELPTMLRTFSSLFGQYPFVDEKYGVVETGGSGGIGGAMEHQTIASMGRIDHASSVMAHELSHQWWGDEVTCGTWYDIWLNEGFATYSEALYQEFKPQGGIDAYWDRINAVRPWDSDGQVYRTDISTDWDIFDTNDVYDKGGWVLHMLRHVMGDGAFFDALTAYRELYRHKTAVTQDFVDVFSAIYGDDLSWFTDQWVMQPGSPDYEWSYKVARVNGQLEVQLTISQTQWEAGYGLFTMPIDVRITTRTGVLEYQVWNDDWIRTYELPIDSLPLRVELDEDGGVDDRQWILSSSFQVDVQAE